MAKEPFLINPYRVPSSRSQKRKGGLKMAWSGYRKTGRKNPRPRTVVPDWITSRHPKIKELLETRSKTARARLRRMGFSLSEGPQSWEKFRKRKPIKNPLGEEVIVVGSNPRVRSRSRKLASLVRYRDNYGTRAGALKGWRSRRRGGVEMLDNAKRHGSPRHHDNRRRYRQNPAGVVALGDGISLSRPSTLVVPIAVGLAARIATNRLPAMVGFSSPLPKYGVQAGVAIGGGLLLNRFLGKNNAMVWTIVSGVTILENLLNDYVFGRAMAATTTSGLSYEEPAGVGAFPEEGMGAYPYEGGY